MDHSKRHLLRGLCVSTLSGFVVQARLFVCSVIADSADCEPHELNRKSGKVITTYPGGSLLSTRAWRWKFVIGLRAYTFLRTNCDNLQRYPDLARSIGWAIRSQRHPTNYGRTLRSALLVFIAYLAERDRVLSHRHARRVLILAHVCVVIVLEVAVNARGAP